jgi:hypothetical protein
MNWYKQSQTEDDDLLGDSFNEFVMEDAYKNSTIQLDDRVKVFQSSLEKIFTLFRFKIAGWSKGDDGESLAIRTFPINLVSHKNIDKDSPGWIRYNKLENSVIAGLDLNEGERLINCLRGIPGALDVVYKPCDFSPDQTIFKIRFGKKVAIFHS